MTQKTLAKHLDEYTALAQQIAALEAQKQAVADKIKDAMGEAEEVQAGAYGMRNIGASSAENSSIVTGTATCVSPSRSVVVAMARLLATFRRIQP